MDLNEIRKEINTVNNEILELFIKRMELCEQVADYKKANGLPIFQSGREDEIISSVRENSPEKYKDSAETLFRTLMELSKELQKSRMN